MRISDWSSDVCSSDLQAEKAGRDDFGGGEQHADRQPHPVRFHAGQPFGHGQAPALRSSASRASSPMPPSVPINCVASTGKRMVLLFGLVANRLTASTYFWATK